MTPWMQHTWSSVASFSIFFRSPISIVAILTEAVTSRGTRAVRCHESRSTYLVLVLSQFWFNGSGPEKAGAERKVERGAREKVEREREREREREMRGWGGGGGVGVARRAAKNFATIFTCVSTQTRRI